MRRRTARLLSLASFRNPLFQRIEVESPGNDLLADNKPRCATDVERLSEGRIFLQGLIDLRRVHVLLEPVDIDSDRACHLVDGVLGDLALGRHHRRLKGFVFT